MATRSIDKSIARSRPTGRFLVTALLLVAVAAGVFGLRIAASRGLLPQGANPFQPAPAAARPAAPPANPAIEEAWGIRFTAVNLLADGGIVEIRYEVVDATKGGRIHLDSTLKDLPRLDVEGTSATITSRDLMFHIHRGMGVHDEGRAYSIVYGNANGVVKPGAAVTVVMSDGLKLRHFPVTV
jgi:hypothetical protein